MSEHAFVASYNFDETAPRVGSDLKFTDVPGTAWVMATVSNKDDREKLAAYLAEKGVPVTFEGSSRWDPLDAGFKARLSAVLEEVTGEKRADTSPDIKTPSSEGQEAHREKRRRLERFLRAEGVAYEVTCATQHSDDVCRLVGLDDEPAPDAYCPQCDEPHPPCVYQG